MSAQKAKCDINKNLEELNHQLFAVIRSEEDSLAYPKNKVLTISNILEQNRNNININYQIPDNEYFKSTEPELIGYTALHFALEQNECDEIFQILLKFGADFTIKNNNGDTVLHQASQYLFKDLGKYWDKIGATVSCLEQKDKLVNLLLSSHSFFNVATNPSNHQGISHFHIACLVNDVKAVQLFLDKGVSINKAVNLDSPILPGYTPLHFAIQNNCFRTEILEILIEKGVDKFLKDARKLSPLHLVIKRNIEIIDYISNPGFEDYFELNKRIIKLLIGKSSPKNLQVVDDVGFSYFHAACTLQDIVLVKEMCEQVSDINHSINKDSPHWPGYTALHFAAHFDIQTVNFLVNKGADMLVKDCQEVTPLEIFLQKHDVCDLNWIINYHSPWKNIFFSDNKTKLIDLIISMKKADEFKSFLSKVADVNMYLPCNSLFWPGYTVLHLAVTFCSSDDGFHLYNDHKSYYKNIKKEISIDIIKICLESGADVTTQNSYGSTAVHLAFHKKRMDIVNLLLPRQFRIDNPVDKSGLSHLHIACAITDKYWNIKKNGQHLELLSNPMSTDAALKSRFIVVYDGSNYVNINYVNTGSTPLHVAVNSGNIDLIEKLLKSGFDIDFQNTAGFTPVHHLLTCYTGSLSDREKFQKLLLSSDLRDRVSNCGVSYLHVASYLNSAEAIDKLLDGGADVNATIMPVPLMNDCDSLELQFLSQHQKLLDIDSGISFHRDIHTLNSMNLYANYTPLHFALGEFTHGCVNYEAVDVLLRRGANVFARKANGSVMLYKVLARSYIDLKQKFITQLKRNCDWRKFFDKDCGITMLHLACAALDLNTVVELLNGEVDVNSLCYSDSSVWPGCTPLHVLIASNQYMTMSNSNDDEISKIAKLLLDHGADITFQNPCGRTPLHLSIFKEFTDLRIEFWGLYSRDHHFNFRRILLKYHKNFNNNPTDDRGLSHFHIACICNDVTTVESFLKHGVDVNQSIVYCSKYAGYTALHIAILYKHEEIIRLLLEYNADVNAKDCLMETPLHIVFSYMDSLSYQLENKFLKALLNAGARINEKNTWRITPLEKFLRRIQEMSFLHTINGVILVQNIVNSTKQALCVNAFYPNRGQGFIGLAIREEVTYESILQNPVFQVVINAPDVNGVDFFGRNVIHNIVSVKWQTLEAPVTNNIKIVEKLVGLGFNIDHQDKKGFTPLHTATTFQNLPAIESLLMNGADVNIVDSRLQVPYVHNFDWNEDLEEVGNGPIHEKYHKHFNKLYLFNLDIHALNKEIIAEWKEEHRNDYLLGENETNRARVINESIRLKNVKIEPYMISLRDFLSETNVVVAFPFMAKPKREAITKFFQEKNEYLRRNFPELTGILYLQYRKALARGALIQPAIVALNVLTVIELPFLCSENVLKFLTNAELNNLIAVDI